MTISQAPAGIASVALLAIFACAPAFAHDQASHSPASAAATGDEAAFLAENDAAMAKMMSDMAARPSGDIHRDFVTMMIPHHQGAIDMARAYLRYGNDARLKRIAQEIIVEQLQEIAAMRLALDSRARL